MGYPDTFTAIGIKKSGEWKNPTLFEFTPPPFRDEDIDVEIDACGICGSDLHTVQGKWGEANVPLAVGHEIVGRIVKIGPKAKKGLKLGDRVGVGAQCDCCNSCTSCNESHENNCLKVPIGTYNSDRKEWNYVTQGGNSSHIRLNSQFAFNIPEKLATKDVAPLLCGGITGFTPLLHAKVGKGSKVGISGIGGIGHLSILFAKALGAEVYAISRNSSKKDVSKKLGADGYIAMDDPKSISDHASTLDLVLNTANSFSGSSFNDLLSLIKPHGTFSYVTAPPKEETFNFSPTLLLYKNLSIHGSGIGSPQEIEYMLNFVAEHNIKPWIETFDISEANLGKAWQYVDDGKPRFRVTMVGYDKFFHSK